MKWLVGVAVAAVLGMAGIVFTHGGSRQAIGPAGSSGRIATISTGEAVDLVPHLVEGAWTVVEFTADW